MKAKVDTRNELVANSKKADPEVSLRQADKWLKTYKLQRYVSAVLHERSVHLVIDEAARTELEQLDGCYVVVTDVPVEDAPPQTIWDRYGDLQHVERDFRTMKTTFLELRPIFLRKANRTRAHAFVTMLALKIARELERRVAPLGLTCEDVLERLEGVRPNASASCPHARTGPRCLNPNLSATGSTRAARDASGLGHRAVRAHGAGGEGERSGEPQGSSPCLRAGARTTRVAARAGQDYEEGVGARHGARHPRRGAHRPQLGAERRLGAHRAARAAARGADALRDVRAGR